MSSYLNSILEHLVSGATVVTATRRLSRQLVHGFDLEQQRQGIAAWPTPRTSSWVDWIGSEWRRVSRADPRIGRMTLLDEAQEVFTAFWRYSEMSFQREKNSEF